MIHVNHLQQEVVAFRNGIVQMAVVVEQQVEYAVGLFLIRNEFLGLNVVKAHVAVVNDHKVSVTDLVTVAAHDKERQNCH